MQLLTRLIERWLDNRSIRRYNRIMSDIEGETDPLVKLEKQIILELSGTLLGGMASSTAYMDFKRNYYDKLQSDVLKRNVNEILIKIIESPKHKTSSKIRAVYACADIVIPEALPIIENQLSKTKKDSISKQELEAAIEALKLRRPISELIRERVLRSTSGTTGR